MINVLPLMFTNICPKCNVKIKGRDGTLEADTVDTETGTIIDNSLYEIHFCKECKLMFYVNIATKEIMYNLKDYTYKFGD